jgi:two-component system sensor histidine kinase UhpB
VAASPTVSQTHTTLRRDLSLMGRVLLANAAVLLVASAVLLVSPVTVSSPVVLREVAILSAGVVAIIAINAVILRRAFEPLEQLTEAMSEVEPVGDAVPVPVYGHDREVVELTRAFNEMLARLHSERRESVRRSLQAQEGERHRVAQELHDEVGQSLTAMLLQIERVARSSPKELSHQLDDLRDNVRESLDDIRRIAQRLRPELLDDLGLPSALHALAERVAEQTGLVIETDVDELPGLGGEAELVIYRVAQEALTNTLRHAGASHAVLRVRKVERALVLDVADDGVGLDGAPPGAGIAGMRERALLIGGRLQVQSPPGGGTSVRLTIPQP